jgi:hypothetical protein
MRSGEQTLKRIVYCLRIPAARRADLTDKKLEYARCSRDISPRCRDSSRSRRGRSFDFSRVADLAKPSSAYNPAAGCRFKHPSENSLPVAALISPLDFGDQRRVWQAALTFRISSGVVHFLQQLYLNPPAAAWQVRRRRRRKL